MKPDRSKGTSEMRVHVRDAGNCRSSTLMSRKSAASPIFQAAATSAAEKRRSVPHTRGGIALLLSRWTAWTCAATRCCRKGKVFCQTRGK